MEIKDAYVYFLGQSPRKCGCSFKKRGANRRYIINSDIYVPGIMAYPEFYGKDN